MRASGNAVPLKACELLQYLNSLIFMSVCAGAVIRGKQSETVGVMGQTGLTALATLHPLPD